MMAVNLRRATQNGGERSQCVIINKRTKRFSPIVAQMLTETLQNLRITLYVASASTSSVIVLFVRT
jgi:hypothetical protein